MVKALDLPLCGGTWIFWYDYHSPIEEACQVGFPYGHTARIDTLVNINGLTHPAIFLFFSSSMYI